MRLPNRFGSNSHGSVVRVCVAESVAVIDRAHDTTHMRSTEVVFMHKIWKMHPFCFWGAATWGRLAHARHVCACLHYMEDVKVVFLERNHSGAAWVCNACGQSLCLGPTLPQYRNGWCGLASSQPFFSFSTCRPWGTVLVLL